MDWAKDLGIHIEFIQPSNQQQNAYVERFNQTVCYEWLSQYHWVLLAQVQDYATAWMWSYNQDRPHMALGRMTPKQRLAMSAKTFYFPPRWKLGGLPSTRVSLS
jgi:putative transposase